MDYNLINDKIIQIFKEFNIHSFPINCLDLVKKFNISLYPYSELDGKLLEYCMKCSDDAYCYKDKIFYNDSISKSRINFSLMHELGHIVLEHGDVHTPQKEQEANYFSSHILAPRMAIHYSHCKNYIHVAKQFNISFEAASIAFDDYRRWHRKAVYKMDSFDKAMYNHFYNEEIKGFAYSIKKCKLCGKELVNTGQDNCPSCRVRVAPRFNTYEEEGFRQAESYWLYGGL